MRNQFTQRFNALKPSMAAVINDVSHFRKIMNVFLLVSIVTTSMLALLPSGMAAPDLSDVVNNTAKTIYLAIVGISTALAVVAETIAALMYFFSSNGRTVETASAWMKRIALAWVFINSMNLFVSFIESLVSNGGYRWNGGGGTTAPTTTAPPSTTGGGGGGGSI